MAYTQVRVLGWRWGAVPLQGGEKMLHIDLEKAMFLVDQSIKQRGEDYVYKKVDGSCQYVHDIHQPWDEELEEYGEDDFSEATPGCLVGFALHKGGLELEVLGTADRNDDGSYDLLNKLSSEGRVTFTDQGSNYLANCQASQDSGAPWGKAAEAAARGMQLDPVFDQYGNRTDKFTEREGASVA